MPRISAVIINRSVNHRGLLLHTFILTYLVTYLINIDIDISSMSYRISTSYLIRKSYIEASLLLTLFYAYLHLFILRSITVV